MSTPDLLFLKLEVFQSKLTAQVTGGEDDLRFAEGQYKAMRAELLSEPRVNKLLPDFVRDCRDTLQLWSYFKRLSDHYQPRRDHIWEAFNPIFRSLESFDTTPIDATTSAILATVDVEHVFAAWQQALQRRETDPEGAITIARTLLESVCKHILDDKGVKYEPGMDLNKLYKTTAKQLNLSPDSHTEQVFKQILTGCQSVVEGLASVRNSLGDAHGKGKGGVKPAPRHAELAVNMAATMAIFLVRTWKK